MNIILNIIIFIIIFIIFYFINKFIKKNLENFCFGNDFCNGNKENALCINQECKPCGLVPSCKKDSDCGPNNCIKGCCDTL